MATIKVTYFFNLVDSIKLFYYQYMLFKIWVIYFLGALRLLL